MKKEIDLKRLVVVCAPGEGARIGTAWRPDSPFLVLGYMPAGDAGTFTIRRARKSDSPAEPRYWVDFDATGLAFGVYARRPPKREGRTVKTYVLERSE